MLDFVESEVSAEDLRRADEVADPHSKGELYSFDLPGRPHFIDKLTEIVGRLLKTSAPGQ